MARRLTLTAAIVGALGALAGGGASVGNLSVATGPTAVPASSLAPGTTAPPQNAPAQAPAQPVGTTATAPRTRRRLYGDGGMRHADDWHRNPYNGERAIDRLNASQKRARRSRRADARHRRSAR